MQSNINESESLAWLANSQLTQLAAASQLIGAGGSGSLNTAEALPAMAAASQPSQRGSWRWLWL